MRYLLDPGVMCEVQRFDTLDAARAAHWACRSPEASLYRSVPGGLERWSSGLWVSASETAPIKVQEAA